MKPFVVDITPIYNDLQVRKRLEHSNFEPNDRDYVMDRFVINVTTDGETLSVKGYGYNTATIQIPDAYTMDYDLRHYLYGGGEAAAIVNGKVLPFDILHDGDGVFLSVNIPHFVAHPVPYKSTVEIVSNKEALLLLKKGVIAKYNEEILVNASKMIRSTVRSDSQSDIILAETPPKEDGSILYTIASMRDLKGVPAPSGSVVSAGYAGGVEKTKIIAHINLYHVVSHPSGSSKILTMYPGQRGNFYQMLSLHGENSLRSTGDNHVTVFGIPQFCMEQ
jgi:hypothetical protein